MTITSNHILAIIVLTACTLSIVVFNSANAENMSKSQYNEIDKNLNFAYTLAKLSCKSQMDNEIELCEAKAEGALIIKKTTLIANYKPTIQNRYNANMVAAGANYSIALKECENEKNSDVVMCKKNKKDTYLQASANARLQRNSEKADEIKKDKIAKFEQFSYQDKSFIVDIFDRIYHVKA